MRPCPPGPPPIRAWTRARAVAIGSAAIMMAAIAALSSLVAAGQAAQGTNPPAQQPRFRAGTAFVRVDVYASKDGHPVADLTAADFDVREDGQPQKIETFERVTVRPAGEEETRIDPSTVGQSRQAASDPRARVFVLFLDSYHVRLMSSWNVRRALIRMLDGVIGQDDLVAVMRPEMSAADLSFVRKTGSIQALVTDAWGWGRRDEITRLDPQEQAYAECYAMGDPSAENQDTGIASRMIARRREKLTLDALWDLVTHLDGLREERKAVLTISEGWRLFGEDRTLMQGTPQRPGVGVGPDGRLRAGETDPRYALPRQACDRDRMALAQLDNEWVFRRLIDEANRANVSFYAIDPRGLPVFDTDVGPAPPPPVEVDMNRLRGRIETLRTLAGATDGLAIVNSNDITSGIKRLVEDLTSYYLLGYSSTNPKLDGKFRAISVRVKRPGVDVRARRGYRAPTEEELSARVTAGSGAAAPVTPVAYALESLASIRPEVLFHVRTSAGWRGVRPSDGAIWLVGEIESRAFQQPEWHAGAAAQIDVEASDGETLASSRVEIKPGARAFSLMLPEDEPGFTAGEYRIRVRVTPAAGGGLPFVETLPVKVQSGAVASAEGAVGQPLLFRRGPSSGVEFVPTADPRFRRQERVRVDVPIAGPVTEPVARLLDQKGQPLPLPVSAAERKEGTRRWLAAEVTLAPLGAGDYLVEITARGPSGELKSLIAFRLLS